MASVPLRADQDSVHFVVRDIDLKVATTTQLVPLVSGRRFIIHRIFIVPVTATSFTVSPTYKIIWSDSGLDIVASTTLTSLVAFEHTEHSPTATVRAYLMTSVAPYLSITAGATATTAKADIHVIGYFVT